MSEPTAAAPAVAEKPKKPRKPRVSKEEKAKLAKEKSAAMFKVLESLEPVPVDRLPPPAVLVKKEESDPAAGVNLPPEPQKKPIAVDDQPKPPRKRRIEKPEEEQPKPQQRRVDYTALATFIDAEVRKVDPWYRWKFAALTGTAAGVLAYAHAPKIMATFYV